MKRLLCGLVALGGLLGVTGQANADYSYTTIDVPGSVDNQAFGINSAGQIVGLYNTPSSNFQGFLYSGGSYTIIQLSQLGTFPSGINDSSQVVGSQTLLVSIVPQRTTQAGFLLNGSNTTMLTVPGSNFTEANGINNAGLIVGRYEILNAVGVHGFLLSGGSYTTLDVPGAIQSFANGINNAGLVVGGYNNNDPVHSHGFLLSGGSYTTLDFPGSTSTVANGMNTAGQIVGDYADGRRHGFLLSGGTYTTLDVPGSTLTFANGINDSGDIVGYYWDAGGQHGFVATLAPIPEPTSVVLLSIGTLSVIGWTRRPRARAR
jgi:probable HAF family extracellular repeat protein